MWSQTLFSISYVNDLSPQVKSCKLEVKVGDLIVSIHLYGDDVILLAEHEKVMQKILNFVAECSW